MLEIKTRRYDKFIEVIVSIGHHSTFDLGLLDIKEINELKNTLQGAIDDIDNDISKYPKLKE